MADWGKQSKVTRLGYRLKENISDPTPGMQLKVFLLVSSYDSFLYSTIVSAFFSHYTRFQN